MAGIGITRGSHILVDLDDNSAVFLEVEQIIEGVNSNVTQQVYASGEQRSIVGYSSFSRITLKCARLSYDDLDWLYTRSGRSLVYGDHRSINARVTLGDVRRNSKGTEPDELVFGVVVELYLVSANINSSLPTDADLLVLG